MSEDVKQAFDGFLTAFEEFKASNDARLKEIEKRGSADVVLEEKVSKISDALDKFEGINQRLTQAEQKTKALEQVEKRCDEIEAKINRPGAGGADEAERKAKEYKAAFARYLRIDNHEDLGADERKMFAERKSLVAGNDTLGGYLVSPADMQRDILKDVVEMSPLRAVATVRTIGGPSLKQPRRTGTFAARRVGETETRTETTGLKYGMFEVHAPEMYAEVHVSQQMLEDSEYDLEMELTSEFAEQFAVKEGKEFVDGKGAANEAEGILTNADVGTTVSGHASQITADGLIDLFYGLKSFYSRNGVWVLNRLSIRDIRKLKDSQNQYLWQPGLAGNVPNTILGAPYIEMPDMPNAAANAHPVAFGDFRRGYVVVDRILISVLRDPYSKSNDGLIVFRARKRTGGGVRQAEAIRKLKCATS